MKTMRKVVVFLTVLALTVSCFAMTAAATAEEDVIPVVTPVETTPEPEATEPKATEPEATEPEATEPEATEPEVTEPEATEPEVTEPEVTEPEETEEIVIEPELNGSDGEGEEPTIVGSGTCGDNLTWTLDSEGLLTISGSGPMYDYSSTSTNPPPWPDFNVKKVVVESGVTSIGDNAFQSQYYLAEISLPNTLQRIGFNPFGDAKITELVLPESVTELAAGAFIGCNELVSITIPKSVKEFPKRLFENCTALKEVTIPETSTKIASMVFYNCSSLESVVIPESVTTIGGSAFYGCSALVDVTLPSKLESIGDHAFRGCASLDLVILPDTVSSLGRGVFENCTSLLGVYLPIGLTTLTQDMFKGCTSLVEVLVPAEMTLIESRAFYNCNALQAVYFLGTEAQLETIAVDYGNDILFIVDWYYVTITTKDPEDVTTSDGMTVSFSVEVSRDNCTYQWYYADEDDEEWVMCTDPGAKKATYTLTATEDINDRWFCCQIFDEWGGEFWSDYALLTVLPAPKFTTQPQNAQAKSGETVSTSVVATGKDLTYVWYYTTGGTATKFYKSSNTTDTYSTTMDVSRDGRKVYCVITDKFGNSTQSETAVLSLEKTPISLIQQPEDVTVRSGETASVTVQAAGDGLTYTWYFAAKGSTKFSKSSITTATYSTTMDVSRDGRKVYCVITDVYGQTMTTETATLSLEKSPLSITQQPASVTVVNGAKAATTVKAAGDGLTYTWYFTSGGSSTKFSKSSITSATYSTTMNADRHGRQVYCVITDIYGQTATTETVTLYMKDAIKIVTQPQTVKVASGETAKVTVEAEGEGLTYTWYYANKGKTTFTKSSYKTATYSTTMDAARDGRRVYCVITDKYGNSVKTSTVTMYLYTPLELLQQPADVLAAEGTKASTTVKVKGDGLSFTWYFTNDANDLTFSKSSITSATYSTTMTADRDGRRVYCIITDRYGNSITTNIATFSMKPKTPLVITQQPQDVVTNGGTLAEAYVGAEGDGLTYTWYFAAKGSSKFSKSSVTGDTYSTTMTEAKDGRKVYCVITDAYGDSVKTKTVTLSLRKSAFVFIQEPSNVTVPNGATASTTVQARGDGLTYVWYFTDNAADKTFSKSSITGPTYSTVMNADRDGRKVYCRVTDMYGRTMDTRTVTLTMDKQPAGEKVELLNHPESVTVAEGETASTTVLAYGDGLTYTWYYTSNGTTSKFYKSSNTTDTYSTVMDASRDGRQVYCVVTDRYGNSVTTHTATLSMKQSETEVSGKMGTVVSSNGINIRSNAGTGYSVVGTYANGTRVEILETKTVSGTVWGRTEKGWISMDYVQLDS